MKTRHRGSTVGIYFPGLSKQEANDILHNVNDIAAVLGFTAERGATTGQGSTGRLLIAIAQGQAYVLHHMLSDNEVSETVASHTDGVTPKLLVSSYS